MFIPNFVDHLVFRVADIERTERFYTVLLGEPYQGDGYIMYMAGHTRLFFTRAADPSTGPVEKDNVGLNHLALGVRTIDELRTIQAQLDASEIVHSGIKFWQDGVTEYIWLDDPDAMRIEFWLRRE
jgi:glyoxylase I family protein